MCAFSKPFIAITTGECLGWETIDSEWDWLTWDQAGCSYDVCYSLSRTDHEKVQNGLKGDQPFFWLIVMPDMKRAGVRGIFPGFHYLVCNIASGKVSKGLRLKVEFRRIDIRLSNERMNEIFLFSVNRC